MSPGLGQALRWLKRLISAAIALAVLAALGLVGLAWRLAEGPLAVPPLARQIERSADAALEGARLEIAEAAIAWEGWRGGTGAPLDIRLSGVRLLDAAGAPRLLLPEAAVTLSLRALLRGTLAPATIELRRPSLLVVRAEDGALGLALGGAETPPTEAELAPGGTGELLPGLLRDLLQPASERGAAHAALRRIRVNGGQIAVVDRAMDRFWSLTDPQIDIRRAAAGGLTAEGAASFRSGDITVPVRLTGAAVAPAGGAPARLSLGIGLPALRPPELAAIWPPLGPLAVLDAAVSLAATAQFDAEARPVGVQAWLQAGAGSLDLGAGRRLGFTGLDAALEGTGRALRLTRARLDLPGAGLDATGEASLRDGSWEATLDLRADPLPAAGLERLWPAALAPEARQAVLRGLAAGLLRDARLRLDLTAPEALDRVELAMGRLGLAANGVVFDLGARGRIAVAAADLAATLTPGLLRLERLALQLPPAGARPGPALAATGEARRAEGLWRGRLELGLDALRFADLAGYWPAALAIGGERDWITRNITAGEIRNGAWRLEAEAPETLAALRLTGLSGTAEAVDATVHWLRPVPPLQGVSGTAEFGLDEIALRGRGGRQLTAEGGRSGLELREATVRFTGLDASPGQAEITAQLAGPLAEAWSVLRHPRLKLFERRRVEIGVAAGTVEARLQVGLPLLAELPMEALRIRATGRIAEARLPNALLEQELSGANLEFAVSTETLRMTGGGVLVGAPVRLALDMDFRPGPAAQLTERATLTGRPEARQLAALGLDAGRLLTGPVGFEARYERRRSGAGQVALRGDLREARLGLEGIAWSKPPGVPGAAEALLRLRGEALDSIESFRLEAPGLALRGRGAFGPRSQLDRVVFAEGAFGTSRFTGEVRRPEREGGPWQASLRGPVLDLRPILGPPGPDRAPPAPPPEPEEPGPPMWLDLGFDQVTMGERRNLLGVQARAGIDARGLLREAQATGRTAAGAGGFEFSLVPRGRQRVLRLVAEDGGALLHALDVVDAVQGGRMVVNATYEALRPGAPLSGTAELEQFAVRDAPAAAKLLQAMTLYGLVEALQGGSGLVFARLVAPFTLTPEALALADARAFSASLGVTAKGRIWRERPAVDIEGTIVPAYLFNSLLGNIPILGRLFSPEAGGGLFAATFRVQGPLADPTVTVNPLAALTPGFLRGLFGIFEAPARR